MPFVTVADERIFYSLNASSQNITLLAIHGSGSDHTSWPETLRYLPRANVYALDLPGHGQSSGNGRTRVDDYADFIETFAAQLDLNEVTLMGHSLGGAIALTLAIRQPKWLKNIILVGTGARLKVQPDILDGMLSNFESTVDVVCQWAFGPAASDALIAKGRKVMLDIPPAVIHGDYIACNQFDIMDNLNRISLATLVISGSADNLTPLKYGQYLQDHIAGAQQAIIQDAGHMMAIEKPDEFTRIVSDFLQTGFIATGANQI